MTIRTPHPNPSDEQRSLTFLIGHAIAQVDASAWPQCQFQFSSGDVLSTSGLWRVVGEGRVLVTSDDHDQWFGLSAPVDAPAGARDAIGDAIVLAVTLGVDTGDLQLQFSNNRRLECIVSSSGYENWDVHKVNGELLVAHTSNQLTFYASAG